MPCRLHAPPLRNVYNERPQEDDPFMAIAADFAISTTGQEVGIKLLYSLNVIT